MKTLITFSPTFNPTSKVLDFGSLRNFNIDKLYAVINVTRNQPIYIPGAPGLGVTSVVGGTLTLAYDTSSHSATDILNVYYNSSSDKLESNLAQESGGNLDDLNDLMRQILTELKVQSVMLKEGLNIRDELDQLRFDIQSADEQ
jgi:hypothetical protein